MTADSSPRRLERALASLRGLAVGDALGSQFFVPANYPLLKRRELPPGPWQWTDDTEMACSVVSVLALHRRVDQDELARSFAEHHDFDRGYGPAVNRLLRLVREGGDWRELEAARAGKWTLASGWWGVWPTDWSGPTSGAIRIWLDAEGKVIADRYDGKAWVPWPPADAPTQDL